MKYMLLIYNDPAQQPKFGTPEFDQFMTGYFAANERMKSDGVLIAGEALQGVETATSLRRKAGKVVTLDGPFAETREYLGGYYVTDFGTIEVRPLMDDNPAGRTDAAGHSRTGPCHGGGSLA